MQDALERLPLAASYLRPVINATGIVLHTNLGRAALSAAAVATLSRAAGYVDVEFDLEGGRRAARGRVTLAALRGLLPEAGDLLGVNNGAAALLLAVTALGAGREMIISTTQIESALNAVIGMNEGPRCWPPRIDRHAEGVGD